MYKLIKNISACCASLLVATSVTANAGSYNGSENRPAIWGGAYVGGSIGGAFSDFDKIEDAFDKREAAGTIIDGDLIEEFDGKKELDTLTGGLHIGYNHQTGNLVLGIEAGVDFLDAGLSGTETENYDDGNFQYTETENSSVKISYLASLRGRIGYATDKTLIYGTAGIAWSELKLKAEENYSDSEGHSESGSISIGEGIRGFVFGGGAEYMLTRNVSLRGEVLHYQFDVDIENDELELETDISTTVGKVGVSYKF